MRLRCVSRVARGASIDVPRVPCVAHHVAQYCSMIASSTTRYREVHRGTARRSAGTFPKKKGQRWARRGRVVIQCTA
eukprot:1280409-Lingulodinium_polyedra.AAC.1